MAELADDQPAPGRVTRSISPSAAPGSATLRSPNEIVTASKAWSRKGSWRASPATNRTGPAHPAASPAGPAGDRGCPRLG